MSQIYNYVAVFYAECQHSVLAQNAYSFFLVSLIESMTASSPSSSLSSLAEAATRATSSLLISYLRRGKKDFLFSEALTHSATYILRTYFFSPPFHMKKRRNW